MVQKSASAEPYADYTTWRETQQEEAVTILRVSEKKGQSPKKCTAT